MEKIYKKIAERDACLQDFLKYDMNLTGRQIKQAKFRTDGILVNGVKRRVTWQIKKGDLAEVKLESSESSSSHLIPCAGELNILYEDEDILAVDKPAGLVVHPSHGHYSDTLSNRLMWYFRQKGEEVCIRSVGRLDKDTSGVVIFAKNRAAAGRLAEQREQGRFTKEYLALIQGYMEEKRGIITIGIEKDENSLMKMKPVPWGKSAVTHYEVMAEGQGYSSVKLRLETGRTHQIRVHMSFTGHPLLGDRLYGEDHECLKRAALHAETVRLVQPFTGELLKIKAPIPEDMAGWIEKMR